MNDALNPPNLNPPSLAEAVNAKGFTAAAGFRVVSVRPGHAEVALSRRDDLLQFFGHFHGGVITALADQAAGIAVTSSLPKGRIGVTVELKINFLVPADGSELVQYLTGAIKVKDRPLPDRLHYCFAFLNSKEFEVSLDAYREFGLSLGFKMVFSGPLVRSSYMADHVSEQAHR